MAYNVFKDPKYKTLPQKNKNTVTYKGQGYSVAPSKQKAFIKQQEEITKKANDKKKDSNDKNKDKKKSISTSVRDMAQSAFNATIGIPTAEAKTVDKVEAPKKVGAEITQAPKKGFMERTVERITDPLGLQPRLRSYTMGGSLKDKVYASEDYANLNDSLISGIAPKYDYSDDIMGNDMDVIGARIQDAQQQANDPFSSFKRLQEKGLEAARSGSPIGSRPKPINQNELNQVTSPFTIQNPFTTIAKEEGDTQMSMMQPDNTPIVNNPGTRRGLLGMGYLSNGVASNGKGNYGFDGASLGDAGQVEDDQGLLEQLFGIPTAQAAELPAMPQMSAQSSSRTPLMNTASPFTGASSYGMSQIPNARDAVAAAYNRSGYSSQGTGGYSAPIQGSGGVAQQYAQDPEADYYNEAVGSYGKQIKAQEKLNKQMQRDLAKAWKAQQEAIAQQYAQSQQEGTQSLEGLKREDLLKLSGLFNFANQDPNSEQRMQYEQRTNNDYAGQLTNLINKLAAAKQQDILSAEGTYNTNLSNVRQQGQSALQALMEAQNNARMNVAKLRADQMAQRAKASSGGGSKSYGSALDQIMATRGVDINTARKIYDKENGLGGSTLDDLLATMVGKQQTSTNPFLR